MVQRLFDAPLVGLGRAPPVSCHHRGYLLGLGRSWAPLRAASAGPQLRHRNRRNTGRLGFRLAPAAAAADWASNGLGHSSAAAAAAAEAEAEVGRHWTLGRVREAWHVWWDIGEGSSEKMPPPAEAAAIFTKFGALLRPERRLLLVASFFMVAAALSELAIPHYISASVFAATKAASPQLFRRNVLLLSAATVGYSVFAGLRGYVFSVVNTNLLQRLRQQLFAALIRQEVSFFDAQEPGGLSSRLGADCSVIARLFATNINVAMRNTMQCIGGGIYLWMLSPRMAAACAGVSALLWAVAIWYGKFTRRAQRIYQDALAESNSAAEEAFTLSRIIRAFGTEAAAGLRYNATLRVLRHISIRQAVAYGSYVTTNHALYNFTRIATLIVGGASALSGAISAQHLTTFVLYVEFVTSAMLAVCDQWGPISEAVGASERVIAYLDRPSAPQLSSGVAPQGVVGQLDIRGVSFHYPSRPDTLALDDVTLTIPAGKLVALVGLSGSGKSTLVALVQRLYDPTQGAVLLDGRDVRELDSNWFRGQIGVVSQDPRLFGLTVAGNIAYGTPGASREEVEAAAQLANAHDFICSLPQGYDTPVTDKLLSGGQRQRIAIARALVRNPRILILDEATSALDAESEAAVQAALDRAMRSNGRTVLVIAHRLSTVRTADLTVVMDKGKVAEVGTHSELIARGGIYAALVRRQSGKMLEQDRDLAPHERPQQPAAAGGGDEGGGGGPGEPSAAEPAAGSVASAATASIDLGGTGEPAAAGAGNILVGAGGAGKADDLPMMRGSSRPAGIASRNSEEPK